MMARKKKSDIVEEQPAQESAPAEIGYKVGQWAGKPQYQCKQCEFDTLDLDAMLEHLLAVHSVIAVDGPVTFPPSAGANPSEIPGTQRADGVFEIELKEDQ
jgi:hypothetical protein